MTPCTAHLFISLMLAHQAKPVAVSGDPDAGYVYHWLAGDVVLGISSGKTENKTDSYSINQNFEVKIL